MFLTILVSALASVITSAIVNTFWPNTSDTVTHHITNNYGRTVDSVQTAQVTSAQGVPAAIPAENVFRMTYHRKTNGGVKVWRVRDTQGNVVASFSDMPTDFYLRTQGVPLDGPVAKAARDYRDRVNARCDDKGKDVRYHD